MKCGICLERAMKIQIRSPEQGNHDRLMKEGAGGDEAPHALDGGNSYPYFPPHHTLTSTVAMGNAALLLSVMRSYCFIALITNCGGRRRRVL